MSVYVSTSLQRYKKCSYYLPFRKKIFLEERFLGGDNTQDGGSTGGGSSTGSDNTGGSSTGSETAGGGSDNEGGDPQNPGDGGDGLDQD